MKGKEVTIVLVVIGAIVLTVFIKRIIQKFMSKYLVIGKLKPLLAKYEGGLSRDSDDNASAYPAPWEWRDPKDGVMKSGWHTNKGVTYQTFKGMASKLGYKATAKNFFEMPDKIWVDIISKGFWEMYPMDEISHLPRIQAVIFTWTWGSGPGGSEKYLAAFQREVMGIKDSNITKAEIVANFKRHVNSLNEKKVFLQLCERRAQDFSQMADYWKYKNNWLKRLNEFKNLFS